MASTLTIDANMRHIQYIVSLFCLCLCIFSAQAQRLACYEKKDPCYFEVIFELDSTFKDVRYVNPLDSAITKRQLLGAQKIIIQHIFPNDGVYKMYIYESKLTSFTSTGLSDDLRLKNPSLFTMKEKKFIIRHLGISPVWLSFVAIGERSEKRNMCPIEIRIIEDP